MNKKEFKNCMQRGLGRCVLALRSSDSIQSYKETVLWGCLHNLAYDRQSEGTRAQYVYELVSCFEDADFFLAPTVAAFEKLPCKEDLLFAHLAELLQCFSADGHEPARRALREKYNALLAHLTAKRRFASYDYARDCFELLAVIFASEEGEAVLNLAADMGSLFLKNPHYSAADFDWFVAVLEGEVGKAKLRRLLKNGAKTSEAVSAFYQSCLAASENTAGERKPRQIPTVGDLQSEIAAGGKLSPAMRVRFMKGASEEQKEILAEQALAEKDPDKKAEFLSAFAFWDGNFPLAHEEVILCAQSENLHLREMALSVLTNCQSETVRAYALQLLAEGKHQSHAIQMLLCNYTPSDKEPLLRELAVLGVDYTDSTDWHAVGSKILTLCANSTRLPKDFLLYVYSTTLCSFCREYAVRALGKRRALTRDMIEECRHDCNAEIRAYVNRYYPPGK